ncbi:amidohydrolase [Paenibacillus polymyxa]|uniref:amidohydrolase n=1 Tax=Paenibacillus polymyxa TaxID=1406 RepID=UPI00307E6393
MSILIKNALILSMMENSKEPYKGDILIKGQFIEEIGENLKSSDPALIVIDAKGMVAMPGLINTHNHTPMSLLRCFSDDLRLMDWLDNKMLPAENRMNEEDIYWGALLGIIEMIKSGTTAYADMYIQMDQIANAVAQSGIRASLTRGLVFFDDDRGKRLQEGIDLVEKWHGKAEGRITTMMGPHAPFTCPPDKLQEVISVADKLEVPIHIHLAETIEEVQKIRIKYNRTPSEYLYDLGLFDNKHHVLLAHAIHLNDSDIQIIKNNLGGVAHNPMSNLKLGCGIADIKKYLDNGVNVGIGTDGPGSASSLDLFKEMKFAAGLQKVEYFDPTVLNAETTLTMATTGGARLLNIYNEVGTLEIGKKADIILVDINKPHLMPHHNIKSLLVYSAIGSDVNTSIIDGEIVMRDGKVLTIDEQEVLEQIAKRSKRIVEGI